MHFLDVGCDQPELRQHGMTMSSMSFSLTQISLPMANDVGWFSLVLINGIGIDKIYSKKLCSIDYFESNHGIGFELK